MSAAGVVVGSPTVIKQLTGKRDSQYDPFPTVGVMNSTLDLDLHGVDIGVNWPLGYSDKFCVWGGDAWGSTWRGSQFTLQDLVSPSTATVHALQSTRAANSFLGRGSGLDTLRLSSTSGFSPTKLVCVNCGGSEGWSTFRFSSASTGGGVFLLEGVEYLGGAPAGSVTAGLAVADGDPRPDGTYRGSVMAVSADTDLSAGINLAFYSRSAGFASGYAMEAAEFAGADLVLGDLYPYFPHTYNPASSGPLFGVTKIERVGGMITFSSAGHGQSNTGPYPRGPFVYVAGAPSTTVRIGSGHTTASTTITLAAGYTTAGMAVAGAASDDRRFIIENSLGQVVKFAYTGLGGGGTTITGVTLISGSGTLATNARLIQGVDDINLTQQQIWDYATSSTIRVTSFGADRIGGTSGFTFLHVPNIDVSNPSTGPRNGWFPTGGFSAANVSGAHSRRQFVALYNSTYSAACTSIDYCYTDDDLESAWPVHGGAGGFTWTRAGSWLNDTDGTGPVQGVCFFDDPANVMGGGASTYKYAFFSPGSFIGRIPLASAHTFANWEYWTGSTWSSTIGSAQRVGFTTAFWGDVNETAQSVSIQYDADLGCFVMMYGYGFVINIRLADDPRATWTQRRGLSIPTAANTNPLDTSFGSNQGYQYGGFMLHATPSTPTGRKRFLFTQFKPYQIYEAELPLALPSGPVEDLTMRNDSVDRQAKTGARTRNAVVDGFTLTGWDGWMAEAVLPTYSSGSGTNTRVYAATSDATTRMSVGWKVRFTDTTMRYGIITALTATTITVYMGTDYVYASTANPTTFQVSPVKSPIGFPMDPAKWSESTVNTSACTKSSPVSGTWYGDTGLSATGPSLAVPIGAWRLLYECEAQCSPGPAVNADVSVTLSTTSSSESDATMSARVFAAAQVSSPQTLGMVHRERQLTLAAAATYYLNIKTSTSSVGSITIAGSATSTVIRAVCAYL